MLTSQRKSHLGSLDALRGLAAFIVVAFHLYHLGSLKLPYWGTVLIAKHGSLGVQWFFVLSAFCMCLGYYGRIDTRDDLKRFFIRRLFRIVPLYYFMIVVWVLTTSQLYGTVHTPGQLILNSMFLVNILTLGSNGIVWAGWTLGVEAAFYLAFPIMIAFLQGIASTTIALIISLAVSLSFMVSLQTGGTPSETSWATYTPQVPFFIAGILAFHIYRRLSTKSDRARWTASNILLATALVWICAIFYFELFTIRFFGVYSVGYMMGVAFVLITISQALWSNAVISNRLTIYLGERGYSLYLLHPFVILMTTPIVQTWIYSDETRGTPSLTLFAIAFLFVATVTSFASMITYQLIEKPGNELGRRMTKLAAHSPNIRERQPPHLH